MRGQALWMGAEGWDPGETESGANIYAVKLAHRGPREPGFDQFFNIDMKVTSKFEPPTVTVDGLATFDKPIFNDEVNSSMHADRLIYNKVNSILGVTMEQWIRAFSNPYHDNYHIIQYRFTNTGNVDGDATIELPDQTIHNFRVAWINRYNSTYQAAGLPGGIGWGRPTMNDVIGDGNKDYDRDFRALYAWNGQYSSFQQWNTIGAPQVTNAGWETAAGDSIGRLAGATFVGRATLHADDQAYSSDTPVTSRGDDPAEPTTTNYIGSDDKLTSANSATNRAQMQEEWNLISAGNVYPFHADIVEPPPAGAGQGGTLDPLEWRERFANQENLPNFNGDAGGISTISGYGPYDLQPGQSVDLVIVEGVDGLSWTHHYVVGYAYNNAFNQYGHPGADTVKFSFDEAYNQAKQRLDTPVLFPHDHLNLTQLTANNTELTKNEWVMTGRDSLMDMFAMARMNLESGYAIPDPPRPAKTFTVTSGTNKILLDWTPYGEGPTIQNWEVYRARTSIDSPFVKIKTLDANATHYEDNTAQRGLEYFYYLQSVGAPQDIQVVRDGVTQTINVPLWSNRYWNQTYAPASLKRPPTGQLSDVRVVPNPYNLASDKNVRWPDRQDKIGFLNVPGFCTIKIFTEVGELIKTIEHSDGSGDEYWSMTTDYNQLVVSGIYLAVIQEKDQQGNATGKQVIRKFTVIR